MQSQPLLHSKRACLALGAGFAGLLVFFLGWYFWEGLIPGNDYPDFQFTSQMIYRFYLKSGLSPSWYAHSEGGFPFSGMVNAELFHWPATLFSLLPGFWSGHAIDYLLLRHLITIGLLQVTCFLFLRRIADIPKVPAFILSGCLIYTAKTMDILRYGFAIETFAFCVALFFLSLTHLKGHVKNAWFWTALCVQGAIASGFLPSLIFCGIALIMGFFILLPDSGRTLLQKKRWLELGLGLSVGLVVASPNLIGLWEAFSANNSRLTNTSIQWAGSLRSLDLNDFLNSLFSPWFADVHTSIASNSLCSVGVLSVFLICFLHRRLWPAALALIWIYGFSSGLGNPIFETTFRFFPPARWLRGPFRVLEMLIPIYALTLCMIWSLWTQDCRFQKKARLMILGMLTLTLIVTTSSTLLEVRSLKDSISPFLHSIPVLGDLLGFLIPAIFSAESVNQGWSESLRVTWGLLGVGTLGLGLAIHFIRRSTRVRGVFVTLAVILSALQSWIVLKHASWIDPVQKARITEQDFIKADHLPLYATRPITAFNGINPHQARTATPPFRWFLEQAGSHAHCYYPVLITAKEVRGPILLPFYLHPSPTCSHSLAGLATSLKRTSCTDLPLLTMDSKTCAPYALAPTPESFIEANQGTVLEQLGPGEVTLKTESHSNAVLVTSFPDVNRRWTAFLDGVPTPIQEVNGSFVGLNLPSGHHQVIFQYQIPFRTLRTLLYALGLFCLFTLSFYSWKGWSRVWVMGLMILWSITFIQEGLTPKTRGATLSNSYASLLQKQLMLWKGAHPQP